MGTAFFPGVKQPGRGVDIPPASSAEIKERYSRIRALKYDSVEIPTRCSFVIEFFIPKFIEGTTCFERHTAHHQEL
jgi:hypothetical protein